MKKNSGKSELWKILIERGFFESRKEIESWILLRNIYVDGNPAKTDSIRVDRVADIYIKDFNKKYVNRGGYKLEGAIRRFGVDLDGLVAIDCGASTGGFTDCLLQHGVRTVYSVDAGHGQLWGKLRQDDRVVNLERTNIGDPKLETLNPEPYVATVDLSYLSLTKSVPVISGLIADDGMMICLVKPIYETRDMEIRSTGLCVRDVT